MLLEAVNALLKGSKTLIDVLSDVIHQAADIICKPLKSCMRLSAKCLDLPIYGCQLFCSRDPFKSCLHFVTDNLSKLIQLFLCKHSKSIRLFPTIVNRAGVYNRCYIQQRSDEARHR